MVILTLILLGYGKTGAAGQTQPAPRSFEAIAVSTSEIRLYWLGAAGATGYTIQRDGQTLTTLPPAATDYADTGLSPDTTHKYVIWANSDSGMVSAERIYTERTFAPFPSSVNPKAVPTAHFDVVVTQASSGGVAAAIEAARRGRKVALIEPTTRVGGMPVNGLSATDLRRPEHASGFFVRFRDRIQDLYAAEGVKASGINYEPRVAHQAMKSLLYEVPGITLFRRARPTRVFTTVTTPDSSRKRLDAVEIEELQADGAPTGRRARLTASVFIDATDCGDIAAWAGADYRLGREARSAREPHNGVIYYDRANDKRLPGSTGKSDHRIQAYGYLLVVKDYGAGADKTIPRPPGYRKEDFIHTPPWKQSWAVTSGRMPGDKLELNQHPQGGDIQEINYRYPTDDYRTRAKIERLYHDHVLGYLYYIQTEQGQKQIGLPDDEYRDTGGFPPLLYVREGRRILGEQLPDESDITNARALVRPESIGLGDYPMDSHAVRHKTDWTTPDMGEGEWWLYRETPWHELPLGILVPRALDNVFVTTAVSSTHVSFGTYRLEPVRMAFGQAAGIAADLCLRFGLRARDVPARQVQDDLLPRFSNPLGDPSVYLTYYPDLKPGSRHYTPIQYLLAHGIALPGENFNPQASTTRGELILVLSQLADRAAPPDRVVSKDPVDNDVIVERAFAPYMGWPSDRKTLDALRGQGNPEAPISRAEFAHWLVRVLPYQFPALAQSTHYSDVLNVWVQADTEALYSLGIDSVLWDNWDAFAPNGKLKFRPQTALSHEDLFAALYLAQKGLGPLFDDNPIDGRNGRETPPALFERVAEPR